MRQRRTGVQHGLSSTDANDDGDVVVDYDNAVNYNNATLLL